MGHTFKVGDIITSYHKGFWQITKIEKRFITEEDKHQFPFWEDDRFQIGDEISSLIYYTKVANSKGLPAKSSKENCCDAFYCKLASEFLSEERLKVKRLEKLIKRYANKEK